MAKSTNDLPQNKMGKKDFVKEGPKKGFCETKRRQPLVSSTNLLAEIEGLLNNLGNL